MKVHWNLLQKGEKLCGLNSQNLFIRRMKKCYFARRVNRKFHLIDPLTNVFSILIMILAKKPGEESFFFFCSNSLLTLHLVLCACESSVSLNLSGELKVFWGQNTHCSHISIKINVILMEWLYKLKKYQGQWPLENYSATRTNVVYLSSHKKLCSKSAVFKVKKFNWP